MYSPSVCEGVGQTLKSLQDHSQVKGNIGFIMLPEMPPFRYHRVSGRFCSVRDNLLVLLEGSYVSLTLHPIYQVPF